MSSVTLNDSPSLMLWRKQASLRITGWVIGSLTRLDFLVDMRYTALGRQQVTVFVKAECFPREVSALILSEKVSDEDCY